MVEFRNDMTVVLHNQMGDDKTIADIARVSTQGLPNDLQTFGEDARAVDELAAKRRDERLVRRLLIDRHGSPFEHSVFTFYVECPIFVAREFFRHRIASYNEESGRYRELRGVFYVPNKDRKLVQSGKPADYTYHEGTEEMHELLLDKTVSTSSEAYENYESLLKAGISREMARIVLPLNLYTSFFVTMNARALMNFLSLRKSEENAYFETNPMREIEVVAEKMSDAAWAHIPATMKAFEEARFVAP